MLEISRPLAVGPAETRPITTGLFDDDLFRDDDENILLSPSTDNDVKLNSTASSVVSKEKATIFDLFIQPK